ncbi:hypothetical protein M8494_27285 [Serratia ureilytica]
MHDLQCQLRRQTAAKEMFRQDHFPPVVMNPQTPTWSLSAITSSWCRSARRKGASRRKALPYPPGVLCVVPGEVWAARCSVTSSALEEGINRLPGFSPELQGLHREKDHGWKRIFGYMIEEKNGPVRTGPSSIHAERVTCGSSSARYSLSPDSGATRRPGAWWSASDTRRPAAWR